MMKKIACALLGSIFLSSCGLIGFHTLIGGYPSPPATTKTSMWVKNGISAAPQDSIGCGGSAGEFGGNFFGEGTAQRIRKWVGCMLSAGFYFNGNCRQLGYGGCEKSIANGGPPPPDPPRRPPGTKSQGQDSRP